MSQSAVTRDSGMRLSIRADATRAIGAGHVMRCVTLAEAWTERGFGTACVVGTVTIPFVLERLRAAGVMHSAAELSGDEEGVVVVDSYVPAVRKELASSRSALRVAVDDSGDWVPGNSEADVVWNPNPHGTRALYPGFAGAVLSGPDRVPIRASLPSWEKAVGGGTAVALGGSALGGPIRDAVVTALADPQFGPVAAVGSWSPPSWTHVPSRDPWKSLVRNCRALVGAGTSAWEAAAIGIPVLVVGIAENQQRSLAWIRERGGATLDLTQQGENPVALIRGALKAARSLPKLWSGTYSVVDELYGRAGG